MTAFDTVAVIGAGTMGRGIAQAAAAKGSAVRLVDQTADHAARGREQIGAILERLVGKGRIDDAEREAVLGRIETGDELAEALAQTDVVVEAVPENLELKQELFTGIVAHAPSHALLGTNTSSLSISRIASPSGAPERVVGLHFFNPVPVMTLLEIVRGDRTTDATVAAARDFAAYLDKEPILVKDVPGFATSRLGVVLGLEAIRMVQQGVASVEDVDKAMELGYRHPMGPLKLTDLVGLDVRMAIADHLWKELNDPCFEPPRLLRQMVAAGRLGKKSGEGFYTYA